MKLRGSITLEASITMTMMLCLILFMMVQAYYFMSVTVMRQMVRKEGLLYVMGEPLRSEADWIEKIPFLTHASIEADTQGNCYIVKVKTEWIPYEIPFFSAMGVDGELETEIEYKNVIDVNALRMRRLFRE